MYFLYTAVILIACAGAAQKVGSSAENAGIPGGAIASSGESDTKRTQHEASGFAPLNEDGAMDLDETTKAAIYRQWEHSHEEEENRGFTMVYRPSGYDFPPSRGR